MGVASCVTRWKSVRWCVLKDMAVALLSRVAARVHEQWAVFENTFPGPEQQRRPLFGAVHALIHLCGCLYVLPQAIPCRLVGVAPVPVSLSMLENGAGMWLCGGWRLILHPPLPSLPFPLPPPSLTAVLRNMAFEQEAHRHEILTFGGIEALLKVCEVMKYIDAFTNVSIMPPSLPPPCS